MDNKLFEELLASVEEMDYIHNLYKLLADTTLEYKKLYMHYLKVHNASYMNQQLLGADLQKLVDGCNEHSYTIPHELSREERRKWISEKCKELLIKLEEN